MTLFSKSKMYNHCFGEVFCEEILVRVRGEAIQGSLGFAVSL